MAFFVLASAAFFDAFVAISFRRSANSFLAGEPAGYTLQVIRPNSFFFDSRLAGYCEFMKRFLALCPLDPENLTFE